MRRMLGLLVVASLPAAGLGCAVAINPQAEGQDSVWVCHGNRTPRWQRVAAPAADAHRRHGDRVSSEPQEQGAGCEN